MRRRAALAVLLFMCAGRIAGATLPIFDSDNFTDGFRGPSMQQSLALTTLFYEESHRAIQHAWARNERYGKMTVALFDAFTSGIIPLPLSDPWLHEEFHRAVMSNRGVSSFNDVYHFAIAPTAIAVSHVTDDALARMKREHPADFVRLQSAGVEGEYALVDRLEREHFFHGSRTYNLPVYWLVKLNASFYVLSGTSREAERQTDRWERDEGTNIKRRDFAGHDFTGWVYDLFRPAEPYEARGTHPSGTGIRRYRRRSDLTAEERRYLDTTGRRTLLNLLDPNLIAIDEFRTGSVRWNASASTLLTSFGTTNDLRAFLEHRGQRVAVTLHRYTNHDRAFPGIELEWIGARIAPRVALWTQPLDQRFRTHDASLGGLAALFVRRGHITFEVEAKSAGWVESNVHLDRAVSVRVGIAK